MIVATTDLLVLDPAWLKEPTPSPTPLLGLADVERRAILEALHRCNGRIYGPGGAAAALGLKPTTLYGRMRKHRIHKRPGALDHE